MIDSRRKKKEEGEGEGRGGGMKSTAVSTVCGVDARMKRGRRNEKEDKRERRVN